jgi:hypothetical protein
MESVTEKIDRLEKELADTKLMLKGANNTIAAIERMIPGWEAYRDLPDALQCLIADLKRGYRYEKRGC